MMRAAPAAPASRTRMAGLDALSETARDSSRAAPARRVTRCSLGIGSWRGRGFALAIASPLLLLGCAATAFPPRDVADPVQVGVLDHGRHTSLIVEVPGNGMIRYAYGDWQWYALRRTGPFEASSALLWPSPAGLGRKELPGPFSPSAVSRQVRVRIEHALYLTVDAGKVRDLIERLDGIFFERRAEHVYNEAYDLVFVPHPKRYSLFHNSNQVVGDWLEQLGCEVEGTTFFSDWRKGAPP